jgi:hypothetical protein
MYRRQNYSGADAIIQPTFKGLAASTLSVVFSSTLKA